MIVFSRDNINAFRLEVTFQCMSLETMVVYSHTVRIAVLSH